MATGNGNFVSGSGYGWRVQVVVNVASETATEITFDVYGQFYNEHRILSFANGSVSGGGQSRSWDGSTRNLNSGNPGTTNFASYSVKLNKGSSARTETFSARFQVTGGYGNGTSNASVGVTVPMISYQQPHPPSNPACERVSDTQQKLTWQGNYTGVDGLFPWSNVLVDRMTDDGSWTQIAKLDWSAVNYTDNGTSANHRYRYALRSTGPGGTSERVECSGGPLYTTPAAPGSVAASKSSASSVTLSAEGLPAWAEGYEISRTADGGGSWQTVGTAGTFPWTDASAPAGTIRYRVRSYRGELYSAYVESNSITTITPPLAPTVQALPSVVATGSTLTVQWTPNHPDGSAQTQAQVEYQVGSAAAKTATVQGAGTSYRLPASATSSAGTVKVRVRTHGLDDEWGAWSAAQTVRVAVPPSANITVPPVDGARVGSLPLTVEWDASDATGVSSQSIALLDSAGSTLYSASLGASERELVLDESTYLLANATDYSLRLTVRGGSSLTTTAARSFSTSFAEPARPDAGLSVDPSDLSAAVTVYAGSPSSETGEVIEVQATPGTLVPGFTVFGNTRQNLWVNPSGTSYGITCTSNADGSVTLSGTSTGSASINHRVYILRPSTQYVFSVNAEVTGAGADGAGFFVEQRDTDGTVIAPVLETVIGMTGTTSVTFTTEAGIAYAYIGFVTARAGVTVSGTYRVMLNEGSEAEPWCPPGLNGVDELSVVTAGKNLYSGKQQASTSGYLRIDVYDSLEQLFVGEKVSISFDVTVPKSGDWRLYAYQGTGLSIDFSSNPSGNGSTIPKIFSLVANQETHIAATGEVFYNPIAGFTLGQVILYLDGVSGTVRADNIQIEFGTEATAYEPPAVTKTAIDLDGHTLNSLPDGTRDELRIDGTGAVTLVQRVGVATAPTEASGWTWDSTGPRGSFTLPATSRNKGTWNQNTELLCDKLPPATSANDVSYAVTVGSNGYAENPAITSTATAATVAGGATYLYPLATPQEVDLPGIAMPAFPAAETQVFCASNVPCEVRVDYPDTSSFTVQRALPDGSRHTIATGLTEGQQALDRLPPLNVDYTYLVTAYAETGVSSTQELPAHVDSGGMEAFNFGQGASIALLMGYNASGSESADHGGTLYDFATGDGSLPLFYPTGALTGSASRSYAVTSREHANRVRALSREYPEAWFRDFDGNRMLCRASFSISLVQGSRDVRTIDVTMDECAFEEASNG